MGLGIAAMMATAAVIGRHPAPPSPPPPPVADTVLVDRVLALEARANALEKTRCLNVTTTKLDVGIFPVEKLP